MDSSDVWTVVQDTRPDDLVAITDPAPDIGPGYRRTLMGEVVYSAAWLGLPDGLPAGCTGAFDPERPELGIQHDAETCPVHEDDPNPAGGEPGDSAVAYIRTAETAVLADLVTLRAPAAQAPVCVVCKLPEDDHDPDDDERHQFIPQRQDPVDARQMALQFATRPTADQHGVIDIGFGAARARSAPVGPTGHLVPVEALLPGGLSPEPLEQARRTCIDALAASCRAIRRYEQVSDDKGDRRILRARRAEVEKIRTLFEEGDET